MSQDLTTVQDMYDLARREAFAFTRRPLHDARAKHTYGQPVQAVDIVATLPRLVESIRYTTKTYRSYVTSSGASHLNGFDQRLRHLRHAMEKMPLHSAGTPVPELASVCRYLNAGADLLRTSMPYAPSGADSTRAHAMDTALGEYADVLHTVIGSIHDKLRPAARSAAPSDLIRPLDSMLSGAAQLRDLPTDPNLRQITEIGLTPARSATVHATLNRWLMEVAPALGTRAENLTGATIALDWKTNHHRTATSVNTTPPQFDARGSSFTLRGIAQAGMVINRAGMQLIKSAHQQSALSRAEATSALEAMGQAGKAWAITARQWDATVKIPGVNPTAGRHHLEGILSATRSLNTVLRPLATGDHVTLRAMTGSRPDIQRCVALAQHLDATLDRIAFTHRRLVDRIADSGQLLAANPTRAADHIPGRIGRATWTPVTSKDSRVQTLTAAASELTHAAEQSTNATSQLRMHALTHRGPTATAEALRIPKLGRISTRPAGADLER